MKILSILFITVFLSCLTNASDKKTVCSITINSDDEIKEFKKSFSPHLWNFVELTNLGSGEKWFLNACKKKVSCDILVISGHFAGTFFGSSDKILSLDDLENYSCIDDCSGIIKKPKEVFLFGCNTLASKEKDRRTPEQYLNVLLDDGFTRAQANEVVAYRYSLYGNSTNHRMMDIFSQTPRIYGFPSVAPVGSKIRSSVKNYLVEAKSSYENFDNMNTKLQASKNRVLVKNLSSFSIHQVTGSAYLAQTEKTKPYCYLQSSEVSRAQKLIYIQDTILSGGMTTTVSHIKNFFLNEDFEQKKDSTQNWNSEEREILASIKANPATKFELEKLFNLKGDVYFGIRANIFQLMKHLALVTEEDYQKNILMLLNLDLNQPVNMQAFDKICSSQLTADISYEQIPSARFKERWFLAVLGCLNVPDLKIQKEILNAFANHYGSTISGSAYWALLKIKKLHPEIQNDILKMYQLPAGSPAALKKKAQLKELVEAFQTL